MNAQFLNVLKWVGILDGATLAAVTYAGQADPAISPTCTTIVMVLGTIGTVIGGFHVSQSKSTPK